MTVRSLGPVAAAKYFTYLTYFVSLRETGGRRSHWRSGPCPRSTTTATPMPGRI
jgi:hypothetical protein